MLFAFDSNWKIEDKVLFNVIDKIVLCLVYFLLKLSQRRVNQDDDGHINAWSRGLRRGNLPVPATPARRTASPPTTQPPSPSTPTRPPRTPPAGRRRHIGRCWRGRRERTHALRCSCYAWRRGHGARWARARSPWGKRDSPCRTC